MTEVRIAGSCLISLLSGLLLPSPSRAGSPTEQVRATVDKVLLVSDPSRKSAGQKDGFRAQLAAVIYPGSTLMKWRSARWDPTGHAAAPRSSENL